MIYLISYYSFKSKWNLPDELERTELLELLGTPLAVNVRLLFKCLVTRRAVIKWLAKGIIPVGGIGLDGFFGLIDLGFGLGLRGGDWVVKPRVVGIRLVDPPIGFWCLWSPLTVSWKTSDWFDGGSFGLLSINASLLVSVRVMRWIRCFLVRIETARKCHFTTTLEYFLQMQIAS